MFYYLFITIDDSDGSLLPVSSVSWLTPAKSIQVQSQPPMIIISGL